MTAPRRPDPRSAARGLDPQVAARGPDPRPAAQRVALVTGATAGIGAAFARRLAADGHALILVARDGDRLTTSAADLTARYEVPVRTLAADLSTQDGVAAAEAVLRSTDVDLLVNSAGMGLNVSVLNSSVADEEMLLRLNVLAVLRLTLAVLPGMTGRGRGAVMNVSSAAGFAAINPGSSYPASKAWVTNFSQSVDLAVRDRGVRVVALCPGFTRTEFHARAGIDPSGIPGWLWLTAETVVDQGLADLRRGRAVSVPAWRYKIITVALRHAPRPVLTRLARAGRRRSGRRDG